MGSKGFTLIEMLITVAIIGILSAIAIPSYRDHVMRSQLADARQRTEDFRTRVEQAFLTPRTYSGVGGSCVFANPPNTLTFNFACVPTGGGTGYTITATGIGGYVSGFIYTTNDANARTSTVPGTAPASWQQLPAGNAVWPANCWIRQPRQC